MSNEKAQSLHRSVQILDCFSQEHPELGVREVARMLNVSSSATGRLMQAMREMGLLHQNSTTRAYSLGTRVLTWAGVYLATSDLRTVALPWLEELHRITRETISLYMLDGSERVCIERLESPQNVRIVARLGRRLPLYAGSAGKVFLAFLPAERRDEILRSVELVPLTSKTIADENVLRGELAKIQRNGYAVSYGEWLLEASGVAAPIFNQQSEVTAALTISGPSQRFNEMTVQGYVQEVVRAAREISISLGYRTNSLNQQPQNPPENGQAVF